MIKILLISTILNALNAQMTYTKGCSCSQYLSQYDCTYNLCYWTSSCKAPVCSTIYSQTKCNEASGCSWGSVESCNPTICSQLNSTSSQGCKSQGCAQSTTKNLDGSYTCQNPTLTPWYGCQAQLTRTTCSNFVECLWTGSKCIDAQCTDLSTSQCVGVYQDSSVSNPVLNICYSLDYQCQNANASLLTQSSCNLISLNSYTWSTSSSKCVPCSSGDSGSQKSEGKSIYIMTTFLLLLILIP